MNNNTKAMAYNFYTKNYMSLGVNEKYVIYSLGNGEIGVVNRATKKIKEIKAFEMLSEADPSQIVFTSQDEAVIKLNDKETMLSDEHRIMTIDLTDFSYSID